MGDRHTFTTTLLWHDSRGGEVEADARVLYSYVKGYAETMTDPGSPGEVDIIEITASDPGIDVPKHFYIDDALIDECLADRAEYEIEAAEWRAQLRRDDLLMEGWS